MNNKGKEFLSDLKLHSDYFKWIESEKRYETWEDSTESILNGHRLRYKHLNIEDLLLDVKSGILNKQILASQRSLQYRYEQLSKHNARLYNCVGSLFDKNDYFQKYFYILLCGCGLDFSLRKRFISQLSKVQTRTKGTKTYIIEDSIEGWADALGVLMSSYFLDNQPFERYAGFKIKFDYSKIRNKGSFISGGFKAPGPEGLQQSLEKIEKLIEGFINNHQVPMTITSILAYDIIMHAADAVLSGGVRRSACSVLIDDDDTEMINAKLGNWRSENPQRARSNNAIGLLRHSFTYEEMNKIISLNEGDSDISFIFVHDDFEISNPCREITFRPILEDGRTGIQACNLSEINASKCIDEKSFLDACRRSSIISTLQAGWTDFPYLGSNTEDLIRKEALIGVSITGWMNNPMLFDPELLQKGAALVKSTNEEIAKRIGINPAGRTTTVKPSGNASVILETASGIHPEHFWRYFRIMQLNKETTTGKYLAKHMPYLLEDSVWSAANSDYAVFVPIENPKDGLFKQDVKGVKHLEYIKLVQENWVNPGTNEQFCLKPWLRNSVSCTVIVDDLSEVTKYIYDNEDSFKAVSFISDYGDKAFSQAPFTSVNSMEDIVAEYGLGAMFASGLIVDGLHYFNNNLWLACEAITKKSVIITGTRDEVMLKKYWLKRAKKFSRNFFDGDLQKAIFCLKDIHLLHKWEIINRDFKEVDFGKILNQPVYKDVSDFAAVACAGGACEITRI